jgi:fatty acid desaturase
MNISDFAKDITALRKEMHASLGPDDLRHLRRVELFGRACTVAGYATAWIFPNPLSALLISQGILTRWMLMHHISHRGYDRVPGVPARYTSKVFAMGRRRFVDWFDWIAPDAWAHEHNVLHHGHTGEFDDPDVVERNVGYLRRSRRPRWRRLLHVAFLAATWKASYYAPNTLLQLQNERRRRRDEEPAEHGFLALFSPRSRDGRELWRRCLLPYALFRFALLPALFLPLGAFAALSVLLTSVLAEVATNVHAFLVIGPNHTGDDLYRFGRPARDKREFLARQVLGSVNYSTGSERRDFLQAYLNYQIEHHLFPDLPMLKYRAVAPRVQELCARHGLRYLQQPLGRRVRKLVAVMIGDASMQRVALLTGAAPP